MHVTTPLNELIAALALAGWEFKGLKVKNGTYVASAKNPQTGQDIERTGNSPEMAVHAVFQHAQRANTIRAFATRQTPKNLLQYAYGENDGQDWQEATQEQEAQAPADSGHQVAAKRSLGQEGPVDYWWPEWEHIDEASKSVVIPHQGYRDTGLIEGAVGNARMAYGYGQHGDIFDTAADIIAKVQRQQAVVEGNKRTATAVGLHFLQENGYDVSGVMQEPFVSELVEAIWQISDAADPLGQAAIDRTASVLRQACRPVKTSAWGLSVPNVHYFDDTYDDTEYVYGVTQTNDSIKDGDILVVPSEEVVGIMMSAWPTAITVERGAFHSIDPNYVAEGQQVPLAGSSGEAWRTIDDGKYLQSYERAVNEAEKLGFKVASLQIIAVQDDPIDLGEPIGEPFIAPPPKPTFAPEEEKIPVTAALGEGENDPLYVPEDIMEKPVEEITDVDNPMGWRVLYVREHESTVAMHSPTYDALWPFGKALEADKLPEKHGNWGINVVKEDKLEILEGYKRGPWVQVKVVTGGKVWPFKDGWRSQFALPYEILVPANVIWHGKWTSKEIANMLRTNYLCDAQVVELGAEKYDVDGWTFKSDEVLLGNGWTYQISKESRGGIYVNIKGDSGEQRALVQGTVLGDKFIIDVILGADDMPLNSESDPEAVAVTKDIFGQLAHEKKWTLIWAQSVDQGKTDTVNTKVAWEEQEFDEPTDVIGLTVLWDKLQANPHEYTDFVTGEGYGDTKWELDEEDIDEFGLPRWQLTQTEYAPRGINLHFENWRNIMKEAVDAIANDNFRGKHIPENKLDELAQAFYGVPTFLVDDEVYGIKFDPSTLSEFFEDEINWGINYAEQILGETAWRQEETLFPTEDYGQAIGLSSHPKLNRFFNLLSWYVHNGQKTTPDNRPQVWGQPQTPQWGEMAVPAIPGAISKTKRDPDYIWIWYKSELRIEKWNHNRKHADMLRELFDEFGRDMNNELLEVDPDQVGAGTVYEYSDESYKVEHEQMNDPEIRTYAEDAIEDWLKSWGEVTFKKKHKKKSTLEDGWVRLANV